MKNSTKTVNISISNSFQLRSLFWKYFLHFCTACSSGAIELTSLYPASSVGCQRDAARICCWVPAPAARCPPRTSRYRLMSPTRSALSSKPVAHRCCYRSMGQTALRTDGRTDRCYRPCCEYYYYCLIRRSSRVHQNIQLTHRVMHNYT